jgi:hypothetical protein
MESSIYTGAADLGILFTYIGAVIFTLIGIFLIYRGIQMIVYPNPSDIQQDSKKNGIIMIISGIVLIGLAWLFVFLAHRYKFFAAAVGVGETVRLFI